MCSNCTLVKVGRNSLIISNSLWPSASLLWMIQCTLLVVLVTRKQSKQSLMWSQVNSMHQLIKYSQHRKLRCSCLEHHLVVSTAQQRMKFSSLVVTTKVNSQRSVKDTQLQRISGIGCQILMNTSAACLLFCWMMANIFTPSVDSARWTP